MNRVPRCFFAAAALFGIYAISACATAPHVNSNGFLVKHGVIISAPPATVYEALVKHVGQWWNPQHTFSGDSKNLSIDARPGGCFCERLPNGGGLEHLRVIYVAPGEILRMSGALGPLQASGVVGSLTWKLTSAPGGTSVELSYAVGGFMEGGLDGIAPAVNDVLEDQLQRFKLFVETGEPTQGIER